MIDISSLPDAMHALKAASDITKLIISSHDGRIVREKAIELQGQIFTAQQNALTAQASQFSLLERIRELEKQIADLEAWETEKQRYELKIVSRGATAYVMKSDAERAEPPHWLCATCYQNGKKSILQAGKSARDGPDFRNTVWICAVCRSEIRTGFRTSPMNEAHPSEM
jgi:hypothetical protein